MHGNNDNHREKEIGSFACRNRDSWIPTGIVAVLKMCSFCSILTHSLLKFRNVYVGDERKLLAGKWPVCMTGIKPSALFFHIPMIDCCGLDHKCPSTKGHCVKGVILVKYCKLVGNHRHPPHRSLLW